MPVYVTPTLVETLSPELRKRMQRKACFNFTKVDEDLLAELATIAARGIPGYRAVAEANAAAR